MEKRLQWWLGSANCCIVIVICLHSMQKKFPTSVLEDAVHLTNQLVIREAQWGMGIISLKGDKGTLLTRHVASQIAIFCSC